jgi:hypothetical protein
MLARTCNPLHQRGRHRVSRVVDRARLTARVRSASRNTSTTMPAKVFWPNPSGATSPRCRARSTSASSGGRDRDGTRKLPAARAKRCSRFAVQGAARLSHRASSAWGGWVPPQSNGIATRANSAPRPKRTGVEDAMLTRQFAHAERGFDPEALSPQGAARGVMQLIPRSVARRIRSHRSVLAPTDRSMAERASCASCCGALQGRRRSSLRSRLHSRRHRALVVAVQGRARPLRETSPTCPRCQVAVRPLSQALRRDVTPFSSRRR